MGTFDFFCARKMKLKKNSSLFVALLQSVLFCLCLYNCNIVVEASSPSSGGSAAASPSVDENGCPPCGPIEPCDATIHAILVHMTAGMNLTEEQMEEQKSALAQEYAELFAEEEEEEGEGEEGEEEEEEGSACILSQYAKDPCMDPPEAFVVQCFPHDEVLEAGCPAGLYLESLTCGATSSQRAHSALWTCFAAAALGIILSQIK